MNKQGITSASHPIRQQLIAYRGLGPVVEHENWYLEENDALADALADLENDEADNTIATLTPSEVGQLFTREESDGAESRRWGTPRTRRLRDLAAKNGELRAARTAARFIGNSTRRRHRKAA